MWLLRVLGVERRADERTIKKAYKKLAWNTFLTGTSVAKAWKKKF